MGVGRAQGRASMVAILALPRGQQRQQVLDEIQLLGAWLALRDAQDSAAKDDFAAGLPGPFATFIAGLAVPPVDQTP